MDIDFRSLATFIGIAVAVIGGIGTLIVNLFSQIGELKGRLGVLESKKNLQEQVDKIHEESVRKLQQRATELHDTTYAQLAHLTTDIAQQQTQVESSMQALNQQGMTLLTEVADKLQRVKQEIEQEIEALRQEQVSTRLASLEVQVERLKDARWFW